MAMLGACEGETARGSPQGHLRCRIEKMCTGIIAFARLRSCLGRSLLRLLYHPIPLPAITYAAPAWWSGRPHHLLKTRVHSLMRSPLFVVTSAYTTTSTTALEVLASSFPLSILLDIETRISDLFHLKRPVDLPNTRVSPTGVDNLLGMTCCHLFV